MCAVRVCVRLCLSLSDCLSVCACAICVPRATQLCFEWRRHRLERERKRERNRRRKRHENNRLPARRRRQRRRQQLAADRSGSDRFGSNINETDRFGCVPLTSPKPSPASSSSQLSSRRRGSDGTCLGLARLAQAIATAKRERERALMSPLDLSHSRRRLRQQWTQMTLARARLCCVTLLSKRLRSQIHSLLAHRNHHKTRSIFGSQTSRSRLRRRRRRQRGPFRPLEWLAVARRP